MTTGGSDFFGVGRDDFFDSDFSIPFFSFEPEFSNSPSQKQTIGGMEDQFYNRYLGELGRMFNTSLDTGGDIPQLSGYDWLSGLDFDREYLAVPPSQRFGGSQSEFRPPTRILFDEFG